MRRTLLSLVVAVLLFSPLPALAQIGQVTNISNSVYGYDPLDWAADETWRRMVTGDDAVESIATLGTITGLALSSGLRLYSTVLMVGLGVRFGWFTPPPALHQLEVLAALDEAKLAQNTVVMFLVDNGRPFPRAKTTLYDAGIRTDDVILAYNGYDLRHELPITRIAVATVAACTGA